ncbi:YheC/YheD family endospore coat-associated protein [Candidatus Contubernalis alkaliaceticus]|uniref:YheC/YheD family endospore coat-associated protein n=1 Tax=Candidatus Contubernalis alkaliaceticus TaxID=338645 RepID=UPI001F4C3431|nr:YheC/YheD family protein [Candidatus Contubernalis alkalaceticus]UNC92310.1 YheC/YheD family protein [Candidatus Contubernalis alkalaceticus]
MGLRMIFRLKLFEQGSKRKCIYLNSYQFSMLKIPPTGFITLQVGSVKVLVKTEKQSFDNSPEIIYLSPEVLLKFSFYQGEPLQLVFCSKINLVLGLSIGLTLSRKSWKNINENTLIKKRALVALEKGILLYCFYLKKVDWKNNLINAYSLNPNTKEWMNSKVPVPQVIFDRGSYPGPGTIYSFSHKEKVKSLLWINNTRTFRKWETFLALNSNEDTNGYMPETTLFSSAALKRFLKKYSSCFVKHNFSRNGKKVLRIQKYKQHYICQRGCAEIESWRFNKLSRLLSFIYKTLGRDIILQQGIILAKMNNSPFDMRILVQKNIYNKWVISALNYRIAQPKAVVTNFSAGATDIFSSPREELLHPGLSWDKLTVFTVNAADAMENFFGPLGEIGFDIAIDEKGILWLIEANSRPSSRAYRDAPTEDFKHIFGLPFDYATFLVNNQFISSFSPNDISSYNIPVVETTAHSGLC